MCAPMVAEKDEVALVVKCDNAPAPERRVLTEQAAKHAPHAQAQPSAEVVQHELRLVRRCFAMILDVSRQRDGRYIEHCSRAIWQMAHDQAVDLLLVFVDDDNVCKAGFDCASHNLLDRVASALVEHSAWEHGLHAHADVRVSSVIGAQL